MNVASLLRAAAGRTGDKPALHVSGGVSISYAQLDAGADRVAAGLGQRGVGRGDRVVIAMPNESHFPSAYFGILRAGAIAVPLNALLTEPEVTRILVDAEPKIVLGAGEFGEMVGLAAAATSSVQETILVNAWDSLGPLGERAPSADVTEDEVAVLAYTSGTTGEPKGAMLTHGNLMANLHQQMQVPGGAVTEDDVLLLALPLFHIFGLNVTLGLLVMTGASGVLVERFDPIQTLALIEEHKVSVLFGAPPMYKAWVEAPGADRYDLSSVRLAVSGAAPLPPETLWSFEEMFGVQIYEGYGLTETAPTLTSNRVGSAPRARSIGRPLPEVEIRLVDEEGTDVEIGDPGEIVVRGPNVFRGYWQRPEETRAALRDGWFLTGDIAVMDEEGYLYLVDRKRDLIIVSGFNVFPSEVEDALLENPKVQQAAVIGVAHAYTGEAVKAYVVLEPGADATEAELLDDVQTRLARFKCPRSIEIVAALPQLATGKVLRRALRT